MPSTQPLGDPGRPLVPLRLQLLQSGRRPGSGFLLPPSNCSGQRHLLRQRDVGEFGVGAPSGYRRSQRPEVQRVVSEVLGGREALPGLRVLPGGRRRREGRRRDERRDRRAGGALGHGGGPIRPPPDGVDGALGDGAQPGGSHQLLLPSAGHERGDAPEQRAVALRLGQHHNEPGR
ncbi:hypothetical protein EYF80_064202 [Liparis tanakae]|uniref:Uncharacterized protein n=1 Tax=Liparis tanakae TaxID=230148 RepID=A0A4Z2E9X1_9TELE|nr:hypothetical protein EYF80_064202 [Liparis tanakae]